MAYPPPWEAENDLLGLYKDDSMKIRDSRSLGGEGMANMENAGPFRIALKAMEKNFKTMSSKIYNFSTMQKYKDAI